MIFIHLAMYAVQCSAPSLTAFSCPTSCTAAKPDLHFASYRADVFSEADVFRLLAHQVADLMVIGHVFGRAKQDSEQAVGK
jgi:hypothetical protein